MKAAQGGKIKPSARVVLPAGILGVLIALFFVLRSCAPGFMGFGTGDGDGTGEQAKSVKQVVEGKPSIAVSMMKGNCFLEQKKYACDELCTWIRQHGEKGVTIVLDSAGTTHQTAETFKECLRKDDFTNSFTHPEKPTE